MTDHSPDRINEARQVAGHLLADLPERWHHTVGVAERAHELAAALHVDRYVVVAAAWLHDIGYSPAIRDTGFHPLDGARHLTRHGWPLRISALVAHHSGARFVAQARGVHDLLLAYPPEETLVADTVTYADQTVGPGGRRMDIRQRIADMLQRHGPNSPNAAAHNLREPYLLGIADRVERHLVAVPSLYAGIEAGDTDGRRASRPGPYA